MLVPDAVSSLPHTWQLVAHQLSYYTLVADWEQDWMLSEQTCNTSRNQVVETERWLWQELESIHFQRWVECMFWKRRNLVTWLHCPDIGSCLISSSINRCIVGRLVWHHQNQIRHVALPGTPSERDDVFISPETIPVPVPPSAVLNNVLGTEHSSPTGATWYYPSRIQNPPAHYSDINISKFANCCFIRERGEILASFPGLPHFLYFGLRSV